MRTIMLLCLILYLFCRPAWAGDAVGRCDDNGELLKCTIGTIRQLERDLPTDAAVHDERVGRYLEMLADKVGYSASPEDVLELKRRSLDLKRLPRENATAIAALDNAIASAAGEIRESMSIEELASRSEVGSNIYPEFLRQKLEFLDSDKGRFYYRGVFELEVLELLANSLEGQYFLDRESQKIDPAKLQRELSVIDQIFDRMNDERYDYILRNRKGTQTDLNSVKLWRASILFVLGKGDGAKAELQDLISENWRFIGQSADVGQAYVYKSLYFPYRIVVQPGKDEKGRANFEVQDKQRVQQFYNVAQLALSLCAILNHEGDKGAEGLAKVIEQFVNRDYYVILAIGPNKSALREFGDAVKAQTLTNPESPGVLKRVTELQGSRLEEKVRRGAQLCGIEDAVRDEVYKPFQLQPSIWGPSGQERNQYQLRVGGGIDENQATMVADFFQRMYSSAELRARSQELKIDADPYAARPRISARNR